MTPTKTVFIVATTGQRSLVMSDALEASGIECDSVPEQMSVSGLSVCMTCVCKKEMCENVILFS